MRPGLIGIKAMQRISLPDAPRRKNPTLHSAAHALADDLANLMGEPKRFAAYLGIAKRYYESDLRGLARRVREKEDLPLDARGKYFFAALRGLAPTRAARKKKKRRRKNKKLKKKNAKRKHGRAARNRQRTA